MRERSPVSEVHCSQGKIVPSLLQLRGVEEIRDVSLPRVKGSNHSWLGKSLLPKLSLLHPQRTWSWPLSWYLQSAVSKKTVADGTALSSLEDRQQDISTDEMNLSEDTQAWAIWPFTLTSQWHFSITFFTRKPFINGMDNIPCKMRRKGQTKPLGRFSSCPAKTPTLQN